MSYLDIAVQIVAPFEGYRRYVYDDGTGVATIGYGETRPDIIARYRGSGIPEPEARKLLRKRLAEFGEGVDRAVKVPMTAPQHAACTSLAYNIGIGSFASSTVVKRLNRRDYRGAARAFLLWNKAGNPPRPWAGLTRRRKAEMNLFLRAVVKPVRLTDEERYHVRLASKKGLSEARRERLSDYLRHQAALIQKAARRQKGGWEKHDRARRFQTLRRALRRLRSRR